MLDGNSNGFYKTNDFRQAVYLRKVGIIYIRTDWTTELDRNQRQRDIAHFVFKQPSDEILSAWASGDDVGVRAILDAADFFRDEIKRRDR